MRFPTVAQLAPPSSQTVAAIYTIFVEQRNNNDLLSARDKNPCILTQHAPARADFSREECGPATGSGQQNANAWIPIVYYETMSARTRNYPTLLPPFLISRRLLRKWQASPRRKREIGPRYDRIPGYPSRLIISPRLFNNSWTIPLSLSLSLSQTNEQTLSTEMARGFRIFRCVKGVEKGRELFSVFTHSLRCGEMNRVCMNTVVDWLQTRARSRLIIIGIDVVRYRQVKPLALIISGKYIYHSLCRY